MVNLTFGEQVKIILSRKGMTIKELAELVEIQTGKPMSRQNMTQRLGRDNFQEKDMRLIAEILGCKFQLSIMEMDPDAKPIEKTVAIIERKESEVVAEEAVPVATIEEEQLEPLEREITVGELLEMNEEAAESVEEEETEYDVIETKKVEDIQETDERKLLRQGIKGYFRKTTPTKGQDVILQEKTETQPILGDVNPYTGKEYKSNSVRMHPKRIGYVQVYDQEQHKWTDMTEWAFLGYQERKKRLLGKDYEPPIYLD